MSISIPSLLLGIAGLVIIAVAWLVYQRGSSFRRRARQTVGEVVEVIAHESSDSMDTYAPRVRYQTDDGRTWERTSTISSSRSPYKVGQRVTVYYLANQPDHARLENEVSINGVLKFIFVFGTGMIAAGVILSRFV
jgi:hypothetical protein